MKKFIFQSIALSIISFQVLLAQQPVKPSSVEIYHQIQKLNFLGSVLYIAAHPDDENTRLISFLSNEKKARTGYLSLTRGDGGQNLIGTELREQLGVIRTQELIEARKIDGGEQFFSRANDFGFSKNPEETFNFWDKEKVMSDIVWIIRNFQPDIIINRFDHRTPGTTHGHHTASAILSTEAFELANNKLVFPEQLKFVSTWQPKKLLLNVSWFFYGGQEQFNKIDKSHLIRFETGSYYPSFGKSNQEIAALSRSRHQSQGFGITGSRGEDLEYFELIKGDHFKEPNNIFEGIDTSWNRIKGGKTIGELLGNVEKNFNFQNPSLSIPDLIKAYLLIQNLEDEHWKKNKIEEIKKIIANCAGLYMEAITETESATRGDNIKLNLEVINRSNLKMELLSIDLPQQTIIKHEILENNINHTFGIDVKLTENIYFTSPYWLNEPSAIGMYKVDQQEKIGIPNIIRELKASFSIKIENVVIPFNRYFVYKYNDPAKGEIYKPFDIVPAVTTSIMDKVKIFNTTAPKKIGVKIKAGKDNCNGTIYLEADKEWLITPKSIPFDLNKKGAEITVYFEITPPKEASEINVKSHVLVDNNRFDNEQIIINYSHIEQQQIIQPSEARFIKLDIETRGEKIGYIMGAGDSVPESLSQMGYKVTIVKPEEITKEKLGDFDAIIVGIRAYNIVNILAFKQELLFDYIKEGGTMIVQYNTNGKLVTKNIAPFPLHISYDRVTDENAEIRFLKPNHKALNFPNKITKKDFQGWVQEQGLYYPNQWGNEFESIISSNDKGESPKNSAILIGKCGKGYYIYTALSFFRELPAGITGAYRIIANLIAINQSEK